MCNQERPKLRDTLEMNESVSLVSGWVGKNKYEGIWKPSNGLQSEWNSGVEAAAP